MIAFTSVKTKKLISRDDPLLTTASNSKADSLVELGAKGFMFAVTRIDPKYGEIRVNWDQREYFSFRNTT